MSFDQLIGRVDNEARARAIAKSNERLREILADSKASHKTFINADGERQIMTTESKIKIYGLPEKSVTDHEVILKYKVITGWTDRNPGTFFQTREPVLEEKREVFKF